jgi:hypothetical protein
MVTLDEILRGVEAIHPKLSTGKTTFLRLTTTQILQPQQLDYSK